jgi:hypothetical protein
MSDKIEPAWSATEWGAAHFPVTLKGNDVLEVRLPLETTDG